MKNLILFSNRCKMDTIITRWMKDNGALNCPMNTIVYLDKNGLINRRKFKKLIKKINNNKIRENH